MTRSPKESAKEPFRFERDDIRECLLALKPGQLTSFAVGVRRAPINFRKKVTAIVKQIKSEQPAFVAHCLLSKDRERVLVVRECMGATNRKEK